ncbi:MAG: putative lipid II flippase FtsW [Alphaproteobacteria bacterium]|jgi:cell division protein FtsW|nr:putative lipid II flippase FtsW [Alphaproteobacteria bacterium]MBT4018933.1 putative lipid II flippase FtsW [Alphaproteobacteria bacterium]MBT4966944.1 putative lipid II flippase FtsW [Alphaproteobacteria bacterium]MBT5160850.1 putative lipid II flippase FtsW [Alphaproteobacteria bacterium]MBT5919625.1 putative lipid II flippase FtsW [Alphaproteobacteria bacterium]
MIGPARTDTSLVGRWWWTVDRWSLVALGALLAAGALLVMAASPAVAERIGLDSFHFVRRQVVYLVPAIGVMILVSLSSPLTVRRLATIGFAVTIALMILTLLVGNEVKGAQRWLSLAGFVIQPSEFIKPFFAVVAAWMFAEQQRGEGFPGYLVSTLMMAVVCTLLVMQPDFGMTVVVAAVWFTQFFMAGMPMTWIIVMGFAGIAGLAAAYALLPHVASRIDRFLDPSSGDSFQVDTALSAFRTGGLTGRGPGEGTVKGILPDAHTDFIFAVAGEEFGLIACLVLVALFAFVVLRGFSRMLMERNAFVMLAAAGLLVQFGIQAFVNMGVNLRLLPAKGMTLPFVSYGGSSLLALAIGMGMVLALTRKRPGSGLVG